MKNYLIVLSAFVCMMTVSSCQKEVSNSDDSGTPPDNTALDKLVITDTSFSSGQDTLYKYEFTYDAQKRLSQTKVTGYVAGTHTVDYEAVENRFYNGTAQYPYKITNQGTPAYPDDFKDENYLFYNADNILTLDSAVLLYLGNTIRLNRSAYYAKGAGRYLIENANYDPATNSLDSKDTIYANAVITNKNLVSGSDSSFSGLLGGLYRVNRYQYTFDSKKNPTAKLRLPVPVNYSGFTDDGILQLANALSSNNIISATNYSWSPTGGETTEVESYSYEYNSDGYPVVIRHTGLSGSKKKEFLFYRKL